MSELGDRIISLRAEGKTYKEIVAETGAAKSTVAYYCGAGVKEGAIARQRDKRNLVRKYVQELKQKTPCADCGENYPYWMMDFDHVRGVKEFNISVYQGKRSTVNQVQKEIDKCDLVCANCHRNRTHLRLVKDGSDTLDISEHYE